jgi:hypothetical protein
MTPKQLIDRQLGELPNANNTTKEIMMCAEKIHGWKIGTLQEAADIIEKEQSRRELLERLIEIIKLQKTRILLSGDPRSRKEIDKYIKYVYASYIQLIEKILSERTSITWDEIVKALED